MLVFLKTIKNPVLYTPVDYLDKLIPGVDVKFGISQK
jgi:hypothetical protein